MHVYRSPMSAQDGAHESAEAMRQGSAESAPARPKRRGTVGVTMVERTSFARVKARVGSVNERSADAHNWAE